MQRKLGEALRNQSDEAGVVRPWRNLAEPDFVAFDEQFDTENPLSPQSIRYRSGDRLGLLEGRFGHCLGLPGFAIVAVGLKVTDRCAKTHPVLSPHRQQRDLVIEIDEAFDDHAAFAGTSPSLRVGPGRFDVIRAENEALPLARRAHDRLNNAGQADACDRLAILLDGPGEQVTRRRQIELLGREPANALAIHGQAGRPRGRNYPESLRFEFNQTWRCNGLYFRHDEIGLFLPYQRFECVAVEHVYHMRAMRNLHGWRIGVAIHGYDLDAESLCLYCAFFAEFAGSEQHHPRGAFGKGRSDCSHRGCFRFGLSGRIGVSAAARHRHRFSWPGNRLHYQ